MLVIGHRGAAGLASENTMEALWAGLHAGADMLEFDVRLTKDNVPVLAHDSSMLRTHHNPSLIHHYTLAELQDRFPKQPITTLSEVLDAFLGVILLNIEIKSPGAGARVARLIQERYIKSPQDWDNILFSSFHPAELASVRRASQQAHLALLHSINPYKFIAHHRKLRLAAVGFYHLHANTLALETAKKTGLFTYVYTVDHPSTALKFARRIDGIVTNRPDLIVRTMKKNMQEIQPANRKGRHAFARLSIRE